MKFLFVAFLALAVGANALPQEYEIESREARIVEGQIRNLIEAFSQWIRDNNWDPLQVNRFYIENEPQPGVNIAMMIEGLDLLGASNIAIHRMSYSLIGNRLQMDLSLPGIRFSLINSRLVIDFHGTEYIGELKGDFVLTSARLTADMRMNVGIISGISIRSVVCTFRIQSMRSDMIMSVNGEDLSERLNVLINDLIPLWLRVNQNAVDAAISRAVLEVGNYILGSRSIVQ